MDTIRVSDAHGIVQDVRSTPAGNGRMSPHYRVSKRRPSLTYPAATQLHPRSPLLLPQRLDAYLAPRADPRRGSGVWGVCVSSAVAVVV